jgi:hypothetical protein
MLKEQIYKLLSIKSLLTIGVVGTMIYLAVIGRIEAQKVYEMALMIASFYFGVKAGVKGA